jgi:hypothetical protein
MKANGNENVTNNNGNNEMKWLVSMKYQYRKLSNMAWHNLKIAVASAPVYRAAAAAKTGSSSERCSGRVRISWFGSVL